MKILPYLLIFIVLLIAGGIYIDRTSGVPENKNVESNQKHGGGAELKSYGPAPEFAGIHKWLNSDPLSIKELKGKVVLVDFWTYSCINCIRTLPHVTKWYDSYKDNGLVIIGVHTPEFEFEKVTQNVQTAIKRHGINYPVAQDNDFDTWNGYQNRYWPAKYLIDQNGNIVYFHFGEGNYDETENLIRQLLGLDKMAEANGNNGQRGQVKTPEIYFGAARLEYITPDQSPSLQPTNYSLPPSLAFNKFALEGVWKFDSEKIILTQPNGKIRLRFSAGKVFMVAEADRSITLKITVDGQTQRGVTVDMSQLYTLFDSSDYGEHIIEITIPDAGFQAFTFTFG